MKTGSLSRSIELAKLALKVGIKELKSKDLNSRLEQAVLIAKSLSQLKGAAMKAGQLLSLDLDNYFPPEAIEILSQLQNAAVAHPFLEIEKILQQELNPISYKLISSIEKEALGVASIGQVHRAYYKNQEIVLKVQFENLEKSIDSDLKILKTIAASFCQVTGRKMNLEPLFQEFRSLLEQELNYELEAKFQNQFQEKISALADSSDYVYKIPSLISELSTKRTLAMSYERGPTLRQWILTNPNEEDKKNLAKAVLDLYFHEFFNWGLVQTDPNWGNFLIDKTNSRLSICLLDFGATRSYTKEFVNNYVELLDLVVKDDKKSLKEKAISFGLIDSRESEEAFTAFENMLKTAIKPFFPGSNTNPKYFDFADAKHLNESQIAVKAMTQKLVFSPPPYSIVFLHRKLAGVYSILKSLNAKMDVSPYWQKMFEHSKV